jgi:hypothetical protein
LQGSSRKAPGIATLALPGFLPLATDSSVLEKRKSPANPALDQQAAAETFNPPKKFY